jgi:hypothetical protein
MSTSTPRVKIPSFAFWTPSLRAPLFPRTSTRDAVVQLAVVREVREAVHVRVRKAVVLDRVAIPGHGVPAELTHRELLLERVGVECVGCRVEVQRK